MDQLQTRLDALEQQMHTVTRRLRWWRGLAGGLLALAVLTWVLPLSTAQEGARSGEQGLAQPVAALEDLLQHFSRKKNEVFLTGANLHIVNGLGQTDCGTEEEPIPDCPNGLGNLIVGYNELRQDAPICEVLPPGDPVCTDTRTGSHNVVVGQEHNFSRFGGVVVGLRNAISGDFAAVSGGNDNTASGIFASVGGGLRNTANSEGSAASGGVNNTASGEASAVSGGRFNTASGRWSAVSAGDGNIASGDTSSVSGGGTRLFTVEGGNIASGIASSVGGGRGNIASGEASAVSGGLNRTAEGDFDWVAGSLVEDE
jgi:trimeric autotransporter adhesin